MRTGLIIFGVLFLVVGVLMYFVPVQEIKADTTTSDGDNIDTRVSYASVTVPISWAYATISAGFILSMLGLALPGRSVRNNSKRDSYDKTVESKEDIEIGDGNKRKIVRQHTEQHKSR